MVNIKITAILIIPLLVVILATYGKYGFQMDIVNAKMPDPNANNTFSSTKAIFATGHPTGYGVYDEKNQTTFKPGETIILYVEPSGFAYKNLTDNNHNKLFSINLHAKLQILSTNGTILAGPIDMPIKPIISHHMNKELYIPITLTQTTPFPSGKYTLKYTISDENSGKALNIDKNITISK